MTRWTGEFEHSSPTFADFEELLGLQQLWERDKRLDELYRLYGEERVDDMRRRKPVLDLNQLAEILRAGSSETL